MILSSGKVARRTSVKVVFDGTDITDDIMPYLTSLSYTDSEEDESDDLQIELQDREGIWLQEWLDKAVQGAAASRLTISASIIPQYWDAEPLAPSAILPTGIFELDSIEASGPPSTLSISAVALPYGTAIRQTRHSKVWKKYNLKGIATEIAGKYGMSCLYESDNNPFYDRREQHTQSDIRFLQNLCHDAGLSLKCTDGKIVLFDQSIYEKKTPVMTVVQGDGSYVDYSLSTGSADTQYGKCRVSYFDPATGKLIEATAEDEGDNAESEQVLEITAKVSSADEALSLAEKQLRLHNKFNRTASFTFPGNVVLVAGVTIRLSGFGGWDGKYIVKQATHTVDSSGYVTKITARKTLVQENQPASGENQSSSSNGTLGTYTVVKGDSLWAIAVKFYGSGAKYTVIQEANADLIAKHNGGPNMIWPGDVLVIPDIGVTSGGVSGTSSPSVSSSSSSSSSSSAGASAASIGMYAKTLH